MMNDLVREGYDKAAQDYANTRYTSFSSKKYLEMFSRMLKKGSTLLDIGCGAGKPIDDYLVTQGFGVNGIDISPQQILLAKKNVPEALYEVKDMSKLKKYEYCVNGIVSFYAIFHTPREQHEQLFKTFASFLPGKGVLLVTMGATDWIGKEHFHGVEMYWSHYGVEKNREIITAAGFTIVFNEIDTTGGEKHLVILATK